MPPGDSAAAAGCIMWPIVWPIGGASCVPIPGARLRCPETPRPGAGTTASPWEKPREQVVGSVGVAVVAVRVDGAAPPGDDQRRLLTKAPTLLPRVFAARRIDKDHSQRLRPHPLPFLQMDQRRRTAKALASPFFAERRHAQTSESLLRAQSSAADFLQCELRHLAGAVFLVELCREAEACKRARCCAPPSRPV